MEMLSCNDSDYYGSMFLTLETGVCLEAMI